MLPGWLFVAALQVLPFRARPSPELALQAEAVPARGTQGPGPGKALEWCSESSSAHSDLTWPVVGWHASLERVDHVAARLQRGLPLDDLPAPS